MSQDSEYDLVKWSILKKDTLLKSRIYMPTNIIREKSISLKLCVGIPRVFKVWTHAEIPTSKNYILKSYLRYLFQTPQLLLLSMQRPARFITSQRLFYIVSGKKDFFWLAWLLGLIWLYLYIKVILLLWFFILISQGLYTINGKWKTDHIIFFIFFKYQE